MGIGAAADVEAGKTLLRTRRFEWLLVNKIRNYSRFRSFGDEDFTAGGVGMPWCFYSGQLRVKPNHQRLVVQTDERVI